MWRSGVTAWGSGANVGPGHWTPHHMRRPMSPNESVSGWSAPALSSEPGLRTLLRDVAQEATSCIPLQVPPPPGGGWQAVHASRTDLQQYCNHRFPKAPGTAIGRAALSNPPDHRRLLDPALCRVLRHRQFSGCLGLTVFG